MKSEQLPFEDNL